MQRHLSVKALPDDLPGAIEVDITNIGIGEAITLAEVGEGKPFRILNADDSVVMAVVTARTVILDEEEMEGEGKEGEEEGENVEAPAAEAAE